jgi:glycosyltransferase involved in cell wall biosynthesis
MRIAYVCADPGIPIFGTKGCSIHVQEVIRAFRQQGAVVEVFTPRPGSDPAADLADLKVHRLPTIPKLEQTVRERVALSINPDLRIELELAGPFDLVYERYSLWSYSALEYAQAQGIPALLEVNAPLIEEQIRYRGLILQEAAERVASRAFQAATGLIAVSQEVKQYLTQWVEADKIHVVANGVNPCRFAMGRPAAAADPRHFTIGFVGSLKPWHGLPCLLEAFAHLYQQVPCARLLIVGDGPARESLEADIQRRGLAPFTHWTGAVPPDQIPGLLASMDVAVAPYPADTQFYFSPLKVYEYMAAGLPVVASRIGQLATLIEDSVTGCLCPPGDAQALAQTLEQLWHSPAQRQRLGQAAQQQILAHHTWDAVVRRVFAIADLTPPARISELERLARTSA